MKRGVLLALFLGQTLFSYAAFGDRAPVSVCANAIEQLATLQTLAPAFQLGKGEARRYLADADRPAEVARLKDIVAGSCNANSDDRLREDAKAKKLHSLRSPACMQDRDRLSMMEKKGARTPEDDLARTRKRVLGQCPDVDLSSVWLLEWIPPPAPSNG